MTKKRDSSRRMFVKTAAVVGAGTMTSAALGGAPEQRLVPSGSCGMPETWDDEADVVIIGYGGAGAAAAIAATDNKASVWLLEKAPFGGGNTGICGGVYILPASVEEGIEFYTKLTQGTIEDKELIRTFVQARMSPPERLRKLGLDIKVGATPTYAPAVVPGRKFLFASFPGGNGEAMFKFLHDQVTKRKIPIRYNTSVKSLVQDPTTKAIVGVTAESGGKTICIRANRGVIMACGGYENNSEMKGWYNFPGVESFPAGTPYNTGDGINMVSEVGAPLWHMSGLEIDGFCYKAPSEKFGVAFDVPRSLLGSYIWVNRNGRRFMAEGLRIAHLKTGVAALDINYEKGEYINLPAFMVFDESCRLQAPLWTSREVQHAIIMAFAAVHNLHQWSEDNNAEIEMGWFLKADSLPELAKKAGIDSAGLQNTVKRYNEFCANKKDLDCNQDPDRLFPLETPPFYCGELAMSIYQTLGGPAHNSKCEVLNKDKKPIPRLYAAGEFGSLLGFLYQPGDSMSEAISFGFIAGEQAAAQEPL